MKTLLKTYLTLAIQLVFFMHSDSFEPGCKFMGDSLEFNYELNISDVQNGLKCCDVIVHGSFYFNVTPPVNPDHLSGIKGLVGIGKKVYMDILFVQGYGHWKILFDPTAKEIERSNEMFNELAKFLNDYQISGVTMRQLGLYLPGTPATAQRVADFAKKLKNNVNNLIVGMGLIGEQYEQFQNQKKFDFTVSNTQIDQYYIDLTVSNYCDENSRHTTINPITSNNTNLLTLKQQSIAVKESKMDQSKVVAELQVSTILTNINDGNIKYGTYSELCSYTKNDDIKKWCSDSSKTLYEQGKFATNYYSGIMLSVMEGDDQYGHCNCGPFVVTNTIISGWKNEPEKTCIKLDELMNIN